MKSVLNQQQIGLTIKRLANQILESTGQLENTVLVGLQPRGIFLSERIVKELAMELDPAQIQYGKMDITFYRDDIRKELHVPNQTDIRFS
ncbi:MAG: bifunctional pyr operon transcriptional regulator/uracil phosphoribosyltransferase PyrR, partial [Chitinophagaceae bacterium]